MGLEILHTWLDSLLSNFIIHLFTINNCVSFTVLLFSVYCIVTFKLLQAYRNFGIRINNLKKRLIDYKETLTGDGDSPIPSPSAEAPSPGNTPPHDTSQDQTEEMDMELSDSEETVCKYQQQNILPYLFLVVLRDQIY